MSTLEEEINRLENEGWRLDVHTEDTAELSRGDEVVNLEADLWGAVKIRNAEVAAAPEDPFQVASDANYEVEEHVDVPESETRKSRPRIGRGWIISAAILIYLIVSYFLQKGD